MPSSTRPVLELRDPVHGAIPVGQGELAVIDTPLFQRLRHVKQLGFGEYVFPGAVHHRYLHSIGAMHIAGEVATRVFQGLPGLDDATRTTLVQAARLAALLHDIGHPPLSHAAESLLPSRGEMLGPHVPNPEGRASHEDVTELILTQGPLAETLTRAFADIGLTSADIAAIIAEKEPQREVFRSGGVDFGALLHTLVSGELDVDRMDYLLRDSYFTGVRYGSYDRAWLVSNIGVEVSEGRALLALDQRALPAFEHFLLARYHMFQMVYYHPISDAYDATLRRWLASVGPEARFPATLEAYVGCTDAWLRARLEASPDPWAKRVVERRPYALLAELRSERDRAERGALEGALAAVGIEAVWLTAKPVLSRYALAPAEHRAHPLLVVDSKPAFGARGGKRIQRIEDVTDLFERYERAMRIERVYVQPEDKARARQALAAL